MISSKTWKIVIMHIPTPWSSCSLPHISYFHSQFWFQYNSLQCFSLKERLPRTFFFKSVNDKIYEFYHLNTPLHKFSKQKTFFCIYCSWIMQQTQVMLFFSLSRCYIKCLESLTTKNFILNWQHVLYCSCVPIDRFCENCLNIYSKTTYFLFCTHLSPSLSWTNLFLVKL